MTIPNRIAYSVFASVTGVACWNARALTDEIHADVTAPRAYWALAQR